MSHVTNVCDCHKHDASAACSSTNFTISARVPSSSSSSLVYQRDITLWALCDMTHSYMWHDSFMRNMTPSHVTWLIHVWYDSYRYRTAGPLWHDSCICVTWLLYSSIRNMTPSHVTWLIHVWHDSFRCRTASSLWHDSCICVTWLLHAFIRNMTPSCVTWLIHMWHYSFRYRTAGSLWHDSFIYVSWIIHMWYDSFICNMTLSYMIVPV